MKTFRSSLGRCSSILWLLAVCLFSQSPSRAQTPGNVDLSFPNPAVVYVGGIKTVVTLADGKVLIGGSFHFYNGIIRDGVARLNANGTLDAGFDPGTGVNGTVYALGVQSDGKMVIVGSFSTVNGTVHRGVARLNPDGSLDGSFNPSVDSEVDAALVQADGKIVIGGRFTSVNGINRNRIARLNSDGSLDVSFDPGTGADGTIQTLAVQTDGKMIVGGDFASVNGTARGRVARLTSSGALDTDFDPGTGASSTVNTMAMQQDGRVVIGGSFGSVNGVARNQVARLNTDGSLDTAYAPTSTSTISPKRLSNKGS